MQGEKVHIGIDFDNTIVCYDTLFHRLASERSLIPQELPVNKIAIRDYLRASGNESEWTALQGIAYGERMAEATPFPDVLHFFRQCIQDGGRLSIISHRTKSPILGKSFNLHLAAREWLRQNGIFEIISPDHVFFELTQKAKVIRLRECSCHFFIDDLPEFLSHPDFPPTTKRVLFDPSDTHAEHDVQWLKLRRWRDVGLHPLDYLAQHGC